MPDKITSGAVEVEVGGEKLMVSAEFAKAYEKETEARSQQFKDLQTQQSQQFESLKEELKPKEPEIKIEEGSFWDDPEAFFKKRDEALREELKREINKKEQEFSQQDSERLFWQGFWEEHDDLDKKKDDFIARAILNRDWKELKGMPGQEAATKLGERTREYLADSLKTRNKPKDKVILEGSRSKVDLEPELQDEEVKPENPNEGSLTEIIRKRNADRRKARHNIRTGTK